MRNRNLIFVAATAVVVAGVLLVRFFSTGPLSFERGTSPGAKGATVMWICTETHETMEAAAEAGPLPNPKTGKPTFVRAMICRKCQKWYPAPPADLRTKQRTGPRCPACGTPLDTSRI